MRRRLPRQEREKLILDEAVRFFAEVGFEGQTRALAQRLGVTQPLLYRYFPDKDALIERVYREVFEGGWDPAWEISLADRSRPLVERVTEFYRNYASRNFSFERVRLFMFAGLKDQTIAHRYLGFVREHLFIPMVRELRHEFGADTSAEISEVEIECVAGLHGAVGYLGTRRWIFQVQASQSMETVIAHQVETFLGGIGTVFRKITPHD